MASVAKSPPVTLRLVSETGGSSQLAISGRLRADTIHAIWREAVTHLSASNTAAPTVLDLSGVEYCDGAGIGMLVDLQMKAEAEGRSLALEGLDARFQKLLEPFADRSFAQGESQKSKCPPFVEGIGRSVVDLFQDALSLLRFIGELVASIFWMAVHPTRIRWGDLLVIAENVGAKALPIVGLISFLIGLIIAFQAAIPLEQFGAQSFVADLVAVSLVRELGPLMTAIILAGRSGAAFAAELGTMKVNEEINALTTMGLRPVRFLVVARVMAAVVMMPLLTMFSLIAGLLGGAVVYLSLGFSYVLYCHQVLAALDLNDFLGGLFKAVVFGLLVGAIGCFRGLQTEIGASAVGLATTRAVVTGITLIIVADGVFSVAFYFLGI